MKKFKTILITLLSAITMISCMGGTSTMAETENGTNSQQTYYGGDETDEGIGFGGRLAICIIISGVVCFSIAGEYIFHKTTNSSIYTKDTNGKKLIKFTRKEDTFKRKYIVDKNK